MVVAPFDTNSETSPEAIMNPATTLAGELPMIEIVVVAMRLSRPLVWTPSARRKPPRKRKIDGLA